MLRGTGKAKPKKSVVRKRKSSGPPMEACAPSDNESVNIRKISNGFLVSKSGYKNGKYFSHDVYSKEDPLRNLPKKEQP